MNVRAHFVNNILVKEVVDDNFCIKNTQDFLDLIANIGTNKIILKKENINPDFFDLKTGLAGEILQKASNYNIFLGFVGDFDNITSKSLHDFIYESNKNKKILFKSGVEEILAIFCS